MSFGDLPFVVFHSMKREILPGISDIGMKVVKN